MSADPKQIEADLARPFDQGEVRFKPAVVKGEQALALAYIDARLVADRLDEVLGVAGWQDEYDPLPSGSVVCRLRLRIGGEWVTKTDVGSPSEQPDEGDRVKAAFSDALKRAAVKFGVGRYLYRLPAQWVPYDPQKRRFKQEPRLPGPAQPPPAKAAPAKTSPARPAAAPVAAKPAAKAGRPVTGAELQQRLHEYDGRLAGQGVCSPGDLVAHVLAAGGRVGYRAPLAEWTGAAIDLAVAETKVFEAARRQRGQPAAAPAPAASGPTLGAGLLAGLEQLLARKGKTPANALAFLKLPTTGRLADLTAEQAGRVTAALEKLPDAGVQ